MPHDRDPSLGLIECRTVARGIEAADAMSKAAPVMLAWTRILDPGRYLVLVSGLADDVRHAVRAGRSAAGDDVHDELFLAGPHRGLLDGLQALPLGAAAPAGGEGRESRPGTLEALGLIECASVASTLLAADAALKHAAVRLVRVRIGADMHGKGLVGLAGEVSDVESAVARGASLAEERGHLVRAVVIPNADPRLFEAVRAG